MIHYFQCTSKSKAKMKSYHRNLLVPPVSALFPSSCNHVFRISNFEGQKLGAVSRGILSICVLGSRNPRILTRGNVKSHLRLNVTSGISLCSGEFTFKKIYVVKNFLLLFSLQITSKSISFNHIMHHRRKLLNSKLVRKFYIYA